MKKLPFAILCGIGAAAIGLSTWAVIRTYTQPTLPIEYTMYVGTNDKDTYQKEKPLEELQAIVYNTVMDFFPDGFTMYHAMGVWRDEHNVVTEEDTFVCIFEGAEKKTVYAAADKLLGLLNQSTILITANAIHLADFYTGSAK